MDQPRPLRYKAGMRYVVSAIAALLIGAGLALWHEWRCARIQEEFTITTIVYRMMHWEVPAESKPGLEQAIRTVLDSAAETLGHPLDEERLRHLSGEQFYEEARLRAKNMPWFLRRERYESTYRELGMPIP
jgi:hypothetical protein